MMESIWIGAAILFFVIQSAALKNVKTVTLRENLFSITCSSSMIGLGFLVWAIITKPVFSMPTLLCGVAFGVLFVVTLAVYYFAMQSGPLSYTGFFFSASMLLPALAGIFFWNEPFNWKIGVGIALFLAAFYFITVPGKTEEKQGSGRWLLLCFITWLANGSLAVIMNIQQKSLTYNGIPAQPGQMMLVSFVTAAIAALIACLLLKKKDTSRPHPLMPVLRNSLWPIVLVALGTGIGNVLMVYLVETVPSSYLYPMVQGSVMLAITLYSMVLLKEKINLFGKIGLLIGLCAIVCINL